MKLVEKYITFENENLILTNFRAMYWKKEEALIASDLHIGKSAHFRKHGIPISSNEQKNDLERLSILIAHYNIKQLIVVGDLFHAEVNTDMDLFRDWRFKHSAINIILIKGNHDRLQMSVYEKFNINCCQKQLYLPPFKFIHEPSNSENDITISGHIHPGISINLKGRPRLRLPCFLVSKNQIILPAFSKFTGLSLKNKAKDTTFHAFTETSFFEF